MRPDSPFLLAISGLGKLRKKREIEVTCNLKVIEK